MILRIDHISIAVKDQEKARHFFTHTLGAIPGVGARDDSMKYDWQVFSLGDLSRLEIINPTEEGSFLDNFLKDKKNGGVHHITLQTSDIHKAIEILKLHNIPYFGFNDYGDAWKEVFIHPKDAFGVLIQIAELIPDDYLGDSVKFPKERKYAVEKTDHGCSIGFAHPGGGKMLLELTENEAKSLIDDIKTVFL